MTRVTILEKIQEIFKEIIDEIEVELTETTTANDVEEWDSITHIEIISEIESQFKIRFSINEIENLKNVGDILSLIETKV